MPGARPTRQRLIDEGLRLFAAQGFGATSVAEIEEAAGLKPRRGGLYKHFANKHALLEAAIGEYRDEAATGMSQLDQLDLAGPAVAPPDALRPTVVALGRWFLEEMDRLETVTRILEHDAARLPQTTAVLKKELVDRSYTTTARLIAAVAPRVPDAEAAAVVVLGSLVALRRTEWTFGESPVGLIDDRFLDMWSDAVLAIVTAYREPAER